VIDPLSVRSLEPLRLVLAATGPKKVIHNAPFERRILAEQGYQIANIVDTLRESRQIAPASSYGLKALCERHLQRILDKSEQMSEWGARPLSKSQLEYAAIDAEVLLDLYDILQQQHEVERTLVKDRALLDGIWSVGWCLNRVTPSASSPEPAPLPVSLLTGSSLSTATEPVRPPSLPPACLRRTPTLEALDRSWFRRELAAAAVDPADLGFAA
jgi:3'-5' exonuclease